MTTEHLLWLAAYITVGVVLARIADRTGLGEMLVLVFWPVHLLFGALFGSLILVTRAITAPTSRERLEHRHRRAQQRIGEIERELDL